MRFKHFLRIFSFIIAMAVIFTVFTIMLNTQNKTWSSRLQGFNLEEENSLDVVMIGASDMFTSYSASVAWRSFGYTSYVYGIDGMEAYLLKPAVKYVLERQSPELIVFEINPVLYNDDMLTFDEQRLHALTDKMTFNSPAKRESIEELDPDGSLIPYYLTLLFNHNNWKEPTTCIRSCVDSINLYTNGASYLKGYCTDAHIDTEKFYGGNRLSKDTHEETLSKLASEQLTDLLDYLTANNIENVLFIRSPHKISENGYYSFKRTNAAEKIIQSYGYDFLNGDKLHDDIGINGATDYYNPNHLNVYGQLKFTDYLGKYLCTNYGVDKCEHSSELISRWDAQADKAMQAIEFIKQKTDQGTDKLLYEGSFDFSGDSVTLR